MGTAIVDYDLYDGSNSVSGCAQYSTAMILVRFRGRPIGRVEAPITNGVLRRADILDALDWRSNHLARRLLVSALLNVQDEIKPASVASATIAICTRDRPEDLQRCLRGVVAVQERGFDTTQPESGEKRVRPEILVVDNCPSDERSLEVVKEFPTARYVREERAGLDHARNRALREAEGEIVAFVDDDAVPDRDWLRALLANYDGPNVRCVTGLTMPLQLETEAQELFEAYYPFSRGFERRTFDGFAHNPLAPGSIGSGTNMSVHRKDVLQNIGGFDNVLDAGTPTQSGGDHEFFTRLLSRGYRIVYEPRALNWHRHRKTAEELEKVVKGYGVGAYSALLASLATAGELGVFAVAYQWLKNEQIPRLRRSWRRSPDDPIRKLIVAELSGCFTAPKNYWKSVRRLQRAGGARYE